MLIMVIWVESAMAFPYLPRSIRLLPHWLFWGSYPREVGVLLMPIAATLAVIGDYLTQSNYRHTERLRTMGLCLILLVGIDWETHSYLQLAVSHPAAHLFIRIVSAALGIFGSWLAVRRLYQPINQSHVPAPTALAGAAATITVYLAFCLPGTFSLVAAASAFTCVAWASLIDRRTAP